MQALLSFDKAPPFAAPLRFFLTAPLFALAAALVLVVAGPEMLASRWSPALLAATHLVTVGFMLQVMLGALIQILPVVAGANLARPLSLARWVHGGLSVGGALLAAGFIAGRPGWLGAAAAIIALAVGGFLVAAVRALAGVPSTSPTIRGLKLALAGLAVAVALGCVLALALAHGWGVPLVQLTDLHAGWALGGWAGVLLAAMAYVVVPMFQLTPGYPARPSWAFPVVLIGLLLLWSLAVAAGLEILGRVAQLAAAVAGVAFAALTMHLQSRRRRARPDATYRSWQFGAACAIVGLAMWSAATVFPVLGDFSGWAPALGVLLIVGGFVSFIIGMLYKIVPFLAWLHLQNLGGGAVAAPPMNRILADAEMSYQVWAHVAAVGVLFAACWQPAWLARPAGVLAALASGWLLFNLAKAFSRYRRHAAGVTVPAGKS
jgi:hypothetical protein